MTSLQELTNRARGVSGLFSLAGKKALVVGGTRGLGQAMALAFAACGADVCVAARGPAGLEETAEAIRSLGRRGMSVAVDVGAEAEVERLIETTAGELDGIDILVNSQGISYLHPSVDFDMERWQRVMDVNLKSIVMTCKHAGRIMLARGWGRIINVSSVRGFQGRVEDMAYAPSKGAVNQLTKSLAIEWGPRGVNVNGLAPTFFRTEISAAYLDDPEKGAWALSRIPMKRFGEPADMFGPAVFLASDACSFVNGHVLMVDGGWLIA